MSYKPQILFCVLAVLTACSRNSPEPASTPLAYDPASATARVFGDIQFEGKPPSMDIIKPGGSRFCVVNAQGIREEDVLVTSDSLLRNAIVYVRSGAADQTYSPPTEPVVLDQKRCQYTPHVLTIMTNQKLNVRNSDDTFHNVHAMAKVSAGFNLGQPNKDQMNTVMFDHAELPIRVGCDLHRWMGAWIGVFDHPFHATTGDSGRYELKLPPGKYEIAVWHEKFGEKVLPVEVADKAQVQLNFTFSEKDAKGAN